MLPTPLARPGAGLRAPAPHPHDALPRRDHSTGTAWGLPPAPAQGTPRAAPRHRPAVIAAATAQAPPRPAGAGGHSALLSSLGSVGDVPPALMPGLLRLAHVKSRVSGGDSNAALQDSARGLLLWKVRAKPDYMLLHLKELLLLHKEVTRPVRVALAPTGQCRRLPACIPSPASLTHL